MKLVAYFFSSTNPSSTTRYCDQVSVEKIELVMPFHFGMLEEIEKTYYKTIHDRYMTRTFMMSKFDYPIIICQVLSNPGLCQGIVRKGGFYETKYWQWKRLQYGLRANRLIFNPVSHGIC